MPNSFDIIKTLIHTEKGTRLEEKGCYLFLVAKNSTKIDIRHAIEKMYKVKVKDVHTVVVRGKMKRVRRDIGKKADWKKAYIQLAAGQKIETK